MLNSIHHPMQTVRPIPIINVYRLKPGDPIWRSVDGIPFLTHYGCFAGFDYLGRPWAFEHTKGANSQLIPFDKFAKGYQVFSEPIEDTERPAAIMRMRELLTNPRQYDELAFHCEHAKNYITEGKAYSPQSMIIFALFGIGVYAMMNQSKSA